MKRLGIEEGGGLPALKKALGFRLYAHINVQEIIEVDAKRFVFRMNNFRVQDARKRRGLPDFPCKEVGIVEYSEFARAILTRGSRPTVWPVPLIRIQTNTGAPGNSPLSSHRLAR